MKKISIVFICLIATQLHALPTWLTSIKNKITGTAAKSSEVAKTTEDNNNPLYAKSNSAKSFSSSPKSASSWDTMSDTEPDSINVSDFKTPYPNIQPLAKSPYLEHFDDASFTGDSGWVKLDSPNNQTKPKSNISPEQNQKLTDIIQFAEHNPSFKELVDLYEKNSQLNKKIKREEPIKPSRYDQYPDIVNLRQDGTNIDRVHKIMTNIKTEETAHINQIKHLDNNQSHDDIITMIAKEKKAAWDNRFKFINEENNRKSTLSDSIHTPIE